MISLAEATALRRQMEQVAVAARKSGQYCDCGKKLNRGAKGIRCRPCWEADKRAAQEASWPKCESCGKRRSKCTRGTLCRSCWYAAGMPARKAA